MKGLVKATENQSGLATCLTFLKGSVYNSCLSSLSPDFSINPNISHHYISSSSGRGLGVQTLETHKERQWRDMVIREKDRRWMQRKGLQQNVGKFDIHVTQGLRSRRADLLRESTQGVAETLLHQKTAPGLAQPWCWPILQDSSDHFALSFSSCVKQWQWLILTHLLRSWASWLCFYKKIQPENCNKLKWCSRNFYLPSWLQERSFPIL